MASAFALTLGACPWDVPQPTAATHTGLVSIQDVSIAGLPQAGHGLTVQASFTPLRAPDFSEPVPGTPFGCQASAYDLSKEPAPPQADQGVLQIEGLNGGALRCVFQEGRGYVCPTATGQSRAQVAAHGTYTLDDLTLTAADVGRYLRVSGARSAENNGAFAIVAVDGAQVSVANPRAVAESFDAAYSVVAGAGPTPGGVYDPFPRDAKISVSLTPGEDAAFGAFDVAVEPGSAMTLDEATAEQIVHVEPDGRAIDLSCGECGPAAASVIRITTTDGDTTGLPPTAMPPAKHWQVEIQCAFPDTDSVHVPEGAMQLIRRAHGEAKVTRIRTAFMREGFAIGKSESASTVVLVGHGILGFSNP